MAEMEKHRIVLVVPVLQELDSPINVFKQAEKMLIFLCNARSTTYLIKISRVLWTFVHDL